jgi:hypothetical protein
MRTRTLVVAGAGVLALGAAGCGSSSSSTPAAPSAAATTRAPEVNPAGDIPDDQAFVAYSPPGATYSVKVPEGWARTSTAGGVTSFTDKLNRVQMQAVPAKVALGVAEARRTELPKLAKSVRGFKAGTVSSVTRSAGRAVRITYLAR